MAAPRLVFLFHHEKKLGVVRGGNLTQQFLDGGLFVDGDHARRFAVGGLNVDFDFFHGGSS
jgi:hypothetical protein